MWQRLLDLCTAVHRPLVFLDFETAGLSGAPPVEFCVAYYAPWCPPEDDLVTRKARAACPPGLTYATLQRLDPGVPIHPDATAIHGITDADVRGKAKPYRDLEVTALFQSLAHGDAAGGEGPAVWVGHNAAEADVPWARRWGYLPDADLDVVDTMRVVRRLGREHPFPLAPDAWTMEHAAGIWSAAVNSGCMSGCPVVIRNSLKPYATNLEGLHVALFDGVHAGGHGALADVCATARCLAGLLELWAPLWSSQSQRDVDPAADLSRLLRTLDAPPPRQLGWDGWVAPCTPVGKGPPLWGRKTRKHTGQPLTVDRSYAEWVLSLPPRPTGTDGESWCGPESRAAIEAALGLVRSIDR